jgi:hypothetical protein
MQDVWPQPLLSKVSGVEGASTIPGLLLRAFWITFGTLLLWSLQEGLESTL